MIRDARRCTVAKRPDAAESGCDCVLAKGYTAEAMAHAIDLAPVLRDLSSTACCCGTWPPN